MNFDLVEVAGFKPAIRFMRNPLKSYAKADTDFSQPDGPDFKIGDADYDLAKRLCLGGSVHRKWMRMVYTWVDITAPLYWWSEADTYSHVPKSSESTMHCLYKDDFIDEDLPMFEANEAQLDIFEPRAVEFEKEALRYASDALCRFQQAYKDADTAGEKNALRHAMKKILPSGFLQKRGVCMNYETLANMYGHRHDHRLPEWSIDFVNFVHTLPYCEFITGDFY